MKKKLTKRVVDALPTPDKGKRVKVFDSALAGFGAVKHPSGQVSFFIQYGGKNHRRITIGKYGPLTVEQAREQARLKLGDVVRGVDPADERKAEKEMPGFTTWADDYLAGVRLRKRSRKSIKGDEFMLKLAKKAWGSRPLDSITADDVERYFRQRAENNGPITANRWLSCVRACFSHAWRQGVIAVNPVARVRPLPENPPRQRVLTDEELTRVVDQIEKLENPHMRLAFELLLTTGARKSEVLRARWEDIDFEDGLWHLPSPKAGHPQKIPLPRSALAMLRNTPRVGAWLIPGRKPENHREDLRRPWKAIRDKAKVEDVTVHDLRRTYGLHAARSAGLHVASKLLRHSSVRITEKVYAPLGIDELRKATEKVGRGRAKVIKLQRKKGKQQSK